MALGMLLDLRAKQNLNYCKKVLSDSSSAATIGLDFSRQTREMDINV